VLPDGIKARGIAEKMGKHRIKITGDSNQRSQKRTKAQDNLEAMEKGANEIGERENIGKRVGTAQGKLFKKSQMGDFGGG